MSPGAFLCPELKAVPRQSLRKGQVPQFLLSVLLCPPKLAAAPSTDYNGFSPPWINSVQPSLEVHKFYCSQHPMARGCTASALNTKVLCFHCFSLPLGNFLEAEGIEPKSAQSFFFHHHHANNCFSLSTGKTCVCMVSAPAEVLSNCFGSLLALEKLYFLYYYCSRRLNFITKCVQGICDWIYFDFASQTDLPTAL